MRFLLSFVVSVVGVVIAVYIGHYLLPNDINFLSGPLRTGQVPLRAVLVFAVILGLLNAFVRPVIKVLTFPLTILTLGLFLLVVNAAMFYLAARLSNRLEVDVLGAFVGAIIVSLVNMVLEVAL